MKHPVPNFIIDLNLLFFFLLIIRGVNNIRSNFLYVWFFPSAEAPSEEKRGFSLEEKSKTSKKRVHYMKFTKGEFFFLFLFFMYMNLTGNLWKYSLLSKNLKKWTDNRKFWFFFFSATQKPPILIQSACLTPSLRPVLFLRILLSFSQPALGQLTPCVLRELIYNSPYSFHYS